MRVWQCRGESAAASSYRVAALEQRARLGGRRCGCTCQRASCEGVATARRRHGTTESFASLPATTARLPADARRLHIAAAAVTVDSRDEQRRLHKPAAFKDDV